MLTGNYQIEFFAQKWHYRIVTLGHKPRNNQEFDVWKMWILWQMILWKCEFCEKWYFEIVNFVKNEILKLWILRKWYFQNVNFWINCEFLPHCAL